MKRTGELATEVLVDKLMIYPIGRVIDIGEIIEGRDKVVSAATTVGRPEALFLTITERGKGLWGNGFIDGEVCKIQIRDCRGDLMLVKEVVEEIVRGIGGTTYTIRATNFSEFDIYEADVKMVRTKSERRATSVEGALAENLIRIEHEARSSWFRKGLAILQADRMLGRKVTRREVMMAMQERGVRNNLRHAQITGLRDVMATFRRAGFTSQEDVRGCDFKTAVAIASHLDSGCITAAKAFIILDAIGRTYRSRDIDFSGIDTPEGVRHILKVLGHD